MKSLKSLLLLVCCALALTACGSSNNPDPEPEPNTLPISGTIEGIPDDVDLAGETIEAQNGSGDVLGEATVNADGTFSVTLREPTAAQLDIESTTGSSLIKPTAVVEGFATCETVDFSDVSAKGAAVAELTIEDFPYILRNASDFDTATAWYDGLDGVTAGQAYIYLYVDRNVTVEATNCTAGESSFNFTADLTEGWNSLEIDKANEVITVAVVDEAGIWYLVLAE
jgi:hypothetical protein